MNTNTPADDRHHSTAGAPPEQSPRFDPQLYDPLPYGTGYPTPEPLGFGVSPEPATTPAAPSRWWSTGGSGRRCSPWPA
ncbi:hypothetical protein BFG51_07700 [Dietzia alimentaria]|nr:hypothetical protein BFG51_07700 [Dietzia alimentaria]